jgi:phosphoribosylaminoimidazole carboxylase (NCAIR synthetase)
VGVAAALADPAVEVTLYDKETVFDRRKMGHVTALDATADEAMARATTAAQRIAWS